MKIVTCGNCNRSWDEDKDPAPSALCHWCNGRGYSTHPVKPFLDGQRRPVYTVTVRGAELAEPWQEHLQAESEVDAIRQALHDYRTENLAIVETVSVMNYS